MAACLSRVTTTSTNITHRRVARLRNSRVCIERPSERARAGMSPEALDGLARAFTRDGYVIVEDVLSPVQLRVLRAECDAVTRRYARLGGTPSRGVEMRARLPRKEEAEAEEEEEDAEPSNVSLEWLSRDFGCILEVPGCCGCCPAPDPRTGGYRSEACAVTRAAVDATLAPDGPLGALARALLGARSHPRQDEKGRTRKNRRERRRTTTCACSTTSTSSSPPRARPRGSRGTGTRSGATRRRVPRRPENAKPKRETSRTSLANLQRVPSTRPYARPLRQPVDRAGRRRRDERVRAGPAVPRRARVRNPRKKRVATSGRFCPENVGAKISLTGNATKRLRRFETCACA